MEPKLDLEQVREDEGKGISYTKRKSRKRRKKKRILKFVLAVLILLFVGLAVSGGVLYYSGQKKISEKGKASRPELKPIETKEVKVQTEILDENTLKYKGEKYKYNEDMISFLFMGIDTSGSIHSEGSEEQVNVAGQADTLILAALNNKKKTITLIPINRDTMTEISIYDIYGKFSGKQKEQVALAYAYGDGEKKSASLTRDAVSNLFYGLPVHGYFAINTSAIAIVNDMVGGVEITLTEDMTDKNPAYTKGSKVLLQGTEAEDYLRTRYGIGDGTNAARMEHQKQYLLALASKMLGAIKADLTLPVSIYQTISDYMVTDISIDEVTYLASQAVNYTLDSDFIRSIPGTSKTDVYTQFYPDEKVLYELILDVFYDKVS